MIRTRLQGATPFFPNMLNNGKVEVCLKEDVDETLAEKDKELRHQKYKRCLDKAKWCEAEVRNIRRTPLCDMSEHEYWQYENDFWQRWQKRWLELAEVFKEAK